MLLNSSLRGRILDRASRRALNDQELALGGCLSSALACHNLAIVLSSLSFGLWKRDPEV